MACEPVEKMRTDWTNLPEHGIRSGLTPPNGLWRGLWLLLALCVVGSAWTQGGRPGGDAPRVYKSRITPHWFADNTRFWYRNDLPGDAREFVAVDANAGTRLPLFDHQRMVSALAAVGLKAPDATHLPFSDIELSSDEKALTFRASGTQWEVDLSSYTCRTQAVESAPSAAGRSETERRGQNRRRSRGGAPWATGDRPLMSPDASWGAFITNHNVCVRSTPEGIERILTQDGEEGYGYGLLQWSPDSRTLLTWRIHQGDRKEVHLIESSPKQGGRAVLRTRPYALPGDRPETPYRLRLFDVANNKQFDPCDSPFEHPWEQPRIHWFKDERRFGFVQVDRGHQRLRVIEVDTATGTARNLVMETSKTFIWTVHTENLRLELVNWLEKTDEIIYASERDGGGTCTWSIPRQVGLRTRSHAVS